jgi:rhamnose utilization protein RhaD (predicted bifunctional aldolase and dehydrogenase)
MQELTTITALSHEFGTPRYVKGGGGNTSVKNGATLWVKPSGTTLAGLTESQFVAMNRAKINELYAVDTPPESAAREELVKNLMAAAVENEAGRPSVEAPLHNVFEAPYVVHTHPAVVNGLTCGKDGAVVCARLLPEALWVEYIDPGYTLCMVVRERIRRYRQQQGREPAILMLKNHGVFVAGQTPDEIRCQYARVLEVLETACRQAGVSLVLPVAEAPRDLAMEGTLRQLFGAEASGLASSGAFKVAPGPLTPDHLVYAKAFPFTGPLTPEGVADYRRVRGYPPKVVVAGARVYGLGASQKHADLALDLAQDAALVLQLTAVFGGVEYMTDPARLFIENWEVESYRQKQA